MESYNGICMVNKFKKLYIFYIISILALHSIVIVWFFNYYFCRYLPPCLLPSPPIKLLRFVLKYSILGILFNRNHRLSNYWGLYLKFIRILQQESPYQIMMFVLKYSYSYTFIKFGVRCSHFFCGYFRIVRLWKFLALMLDEKNYYNK